MCPAASSWCSDSNSPSRRDFLRLPETAPFQTENFLAGNPPAALWSEQATLVLPKNKTVR